MTGNRGDRRPIPARGLSVVKWTARLLHDAGVTPNAISVFGMACAAVAGLCLAMTPLVSSAVRSLFFAAALLIFVRALCNMFDGMVAVEHGKATPTGALFNEIPDRISDAALLVGAGYAVGSEPALGYLAAIIALLIAYVRAAARLAGAPSDFGGIMAKQQRMFSVAAVALWMAFTPTTWHPTFGADERFGLMAVCLALIILGGLQTIAVRLRRAAAYLERGPHE